MNTYSFFITSLIIILLPGTGVIYTISNGLTKGKKQSILAALGCTCGIIPHLIISICLSSLLLKMNTIIFFILKIIGSLYLIYLGLGMIFSKTNLNLNGVDTENNPISIMSKGIFINLLNPKLTLFFFSFLPQYIIYNDKNYIENSFILGFAFMIITFIVFAIYGILAGFMSSLIINFPKRICRAQQVFGIIFILFAVQLAVSSV